MPYDYKQLKAGREEKGWTATKLAEILGVSSWAVGLMERGLRQNPPLIKEYAKAVGIPMKDLVISDEEFEAMRRADVRRADEELEELTGAGPRRKR